MIFRGRTPTPIRLFKREPERKRGVLKVIGWVDQRLLRFMRTRGHNPTTERIAKNLGIFGETGTGWVAIGGLMAAAEPGRRRSWLLAGASGPAAVGINYMFKLAIGRERPLIEDHPMMAKAPSRLSFPSAHATSSVTAAGALAKMEPGLRLPLGGLAAAICVSRPFLAMHYPSDVLAGVALGTFLGRVWPVENANEEIWAK